MNTTIALSVLSLSASVVLGCQSAAEAEHAGGYGYEFAKDAVTATAPSPHAKAAVIHGKAGDRVAPEAIQDVVRAAFPRVYACYAPAAAKDASLTGEVKLRFVIGASGKVESIDHHTSTLPDAAVVSCVSTVAGALEFPASSEGPITVVYPLAFGR